jgi:hypothetical protein
MATFSKKKMGKEVGSASVYAKPHDMSGKETTANDLKQMPARLQSDEIAMSIGRIRSKDYPAVKTDGIKIRGTGAAERGVKARGPMA